VEFAYPFSSTTLYAIQAPVPAQPSSSLLVWLDKLRTLRLGTPAWGHGFVQHLDDGVPAHGVEEDTSHFVEVG
jgi:hypothetical protein